MTRKKPGKRRPETPVLAPWQQRMHEVIFEADTTAGKAFDVGLLLAIVISVVAVMLESVESIRAEWGDYLIAAEWGFTALFTVEYLLRLLCVGRPLRYATSFFGVVDLLAIAPTYLSLFVPGSQSMIVIRTLRLLRIFRVFKLTRYMSEAEALMVAFRRTRRRITVFLTLVFSVVLIMGSLMYLIEGAENGFTSIPTSVYWAVVTMTTVGYGDIAPQTVLGQSLAALAMILGYALIIVPIGVFSVEIAAAGHLDISTQACSSCSREGHDLDAVYCKFCGAKL